MLFLKFNTVATKVLKKRQQFKQLEDISFANDEAYLTESILGKFEQYQQVVRLALDMLWS